MLEEVALTITETVHGVRGHAIHNKRGREKAREKKVNSAAGEAGGNRVGWREGASRARKAKTQPKQCTVDGGRLRQRAKERKKQQRVGTRCERAEEEWGGGIKDKKKSKGKSTSTSCSHGDALVYLCFLFLLMLVLS